MAVTIYEPYRYINNIYGVPKTKYTPPSSAIGYLRLLGAANEALARANSEWGKTYWTNVVGEIRRKTNAKMTEMDLH